MKHKSNSFNLTTNVTSRLKFIHGFAFTIMVVFFCHSSILAGVDTLPHAPTLTLPAIPSDFVVEESYRENVDCFYSIPSGSNISEYDGHDILSMRPYTEDQRYLHGSNSLAEEINIIHVLDIENQFLPQVLPHQLIIARSNSVSFYSEYKGEGIGGNLLHRVSSINGVLPEIEVDTSNLPEFQVDSLGNRILDLDSVIITINNNNGVFSEISYDLNGVWFKKQVTFFDTADTLRGVPLLSVIVVRDSLTSGKCVFRACFRSYTDYYRNDSTANSGSTSGNLTTNSNYALNEEIGMLNIWPNPFNDFVQLTLPDILNVGENVTFKVYSIDGKIVFEQVVEGTQKLSFNLSKLPSGIHIAKLESKNKIWVSKLIKQ